MARPPPARQSISLLILPIGDEAMRPPVSARMCWAIVCPHAIPAELPQHAGGSLPCAYMPSIWMRRVPTCATFIRTARPARPDHARRYVARFRSAYYGPHPARRRQRTCSWRISLAAGRTLTTLLSGLILRFVTLLGWRNSRTSFPPLPDRLFPVNLPLPARLQPLEHAAPKGRFS